MGTYGNICLAIILGAATVLFVGLVIFMGIMAWQEIKSRAENVQPDTKSSPVNVQTPKISLYTCSDGAVFANEDVAKSHEANLKSKQSMN